MPAKKRLIYTILDIFIKNAKKTIANTTKVWYNDRVVCKAYDLWRVSLVSAEGVQSVKRSYLSGKRTGQKANVLLFKAKIVLAFFYCQ